MNVRAAWPNSPSIYIHRVSSAQSPAFDLWSGLITTGVHGWILCYMRTVRQVTCYQQILFTEAFLRFWGHHSCRNFSSCRIQSRWWVVITVVIVQLINNVPGWRIIKMVVMGVDQDQLHANRGQVPQLLQSLYIWISFIKPSRDTWKESTKKAVPTWPNIAFLTSIITIFWSQTLQGCRVTNYK